MPPPTTILWLRRDLRLGDNPALREAATRAGESGGDLLPVFVWEPRERRPWAPGAAGRWWLRASLGALDAEVQRRGSRLALLRGDPAAALPALARAAGADAVVWAAGLEPDELADDAAVAVALREAGVDAVVVPSANLLFDPEAVHTREGRPYTVFTPYWRACLSLPAPEAPLPAPQALPPAPAEPAGLALEALEPGAPASWIAGLAEAWRPGEAGATARLEGRRARPPPSLRRRARPPGPRGHLTPLAAPASG